MLPEALGFGVAIGAGLLIGLDRERRKGQGAGRNAAGIRSFSVAALAGAIAQWLQQPLLVAVGAALVLVLVALAYARSRSDDPGVTTELALFVTYLIGVLAMREPALAAGIAATLALLLAMREGLHRFATAWLSEGELHDGMLLAALTLVVLPLTPAEPVEWLAGLVPRRLVLVTALILAVQAAGHVAARVAGARAGLALAGFFSGFVSSTATIASFGARARGTRLSLHRARPAPCCRPPRPGCRRWCCWSRSRRRWLPRWRRRRSWPAPLPRPAASGERVGGLGAPTTAKPRRAGPPPTPRPAAPTVPVLGTKPAMRAARTRGTASGARCGCARRRCWPRCWSASGS